MYAPGMTEDSVPRVPCVLPFARPHTRVHRVLVPAQAQLVLVELDPDGKVPGFTGDAVHSPARSGVAA